MYLYYCPMQRCTLQRNCSGQSTLAYTCRTNCTIVIKSLYGSFIICEGYSCIGANEVNVFSCLFCQFLNFFSNLALFSFAILVSFFIWHFRLRNINFSLNSFAKRFAPKTSVCATISGANINEYDQMTCQVNDNKAQTLQVTTFYLDDKNWQQKTLFSKT